MRRTKPYTEKDFVTLIELLYDAAGDIMRFPNFLAELERVTGSRNIILRETNHLNNSEAAFMSSNMITAPDPNVRHLYNSYYGLANPFTLIGSPKSKTPGSVFTGQQILDCTEYNKHEFINDFLEPHGWHHLVTMAFFNKGPSTFSLTPMRGKQDKAYEATDIKFLQRLYPHIERAFGLSFKLTKLKAFGGAFEEAINHLPIGVLLVGHDTNIYATNNAADKIIQTNDGLKISREGKLQAATQSDTNNIQKIVHQTVMTARKEGESAGQAITIGRPSGKSPFTALITPLKTTVYPVLSQQPHAAIFITDPENKTETSEETLCTIFGLTPAEAKVANQLTQGKDFSEISDELRLSKNTIKTHSRHIYDKTKVKRKDGLVRLLLTSIATLKTKK